MIKITLPDGSVREYADGVTSLDVAKSISEGLARKVLAAQVNGQDVGCHASSSQRCFFKTAHLG